jgi:ABC-type transport system involved in multi-copper enzyme maturation permease subunit
VLGFLIFIAASILIGLIFLSLSLLFSAFFKRKTMSMGMSIITWIFFLIIYPLIIGMIHLATIPREVMQNMTSGNIQNINYQTPNWYYGANMVNPVTAYSNLVDVNVLNNDFYPSFVNNATLLVILFLWLIIPMVLSFLLFRRRDI